MELHLGPSLVAIPQAGFIWICLLNGSHHFISFVKLSKEDPVLLVVDGHYFHTRNIDVIDLACENGVSIVCLPPQIACSRWMWHS
jgi:hypothetical protein